MSKRCHNFGTKRFKEKSLFIFHARIALKSLILLFVRLIARGARIGKTHRQDKYFNPGACAPRVNYMIVTHDLVNNFFSQSSPGDLTAVEGQRNGKFSQNSKLEQ